MPEEIAATPIANTEQIRQQQMEILSLLTQNGKWAEILTYQYPLIHPLEISFAKERAMDNRLSFIYMQLQQIQQLETLAEDDPDAMAGAEALREPLIKETLDIFRLRKPESSEELSQKKEKTPHVFRIGRDVNVEIAFFRDLGDVKSLTPERIPELALLDKTTIIELHIDTLQNRIDRIKDRNVRWKAAFPDQVGIGRTDENTANSPLEEVNEKIIAKIQKQINALAVELLELESKE